MIIFTVCIKNVIKYKVPSFVFLLFFEFLSCSGPTEQSYSQNKLEAKPVIHHFEVAVFTRSDQKCLNLCKFVIFFYFFYDLSFTDFFIVFHTL